MQTTPRLLTLLALLAGLLGTPGLSAAANPPGDLVAPTDHDAAWLAQARAAYPLKTCLISGEELGGMGEPVEYIYRQAGQPDRLVRFCCKMCVAKFRKDPEKHLARLTTTKPAEPPAAPPHS